MARDFGDIKWAEIKSGCLSNDFLVNCRRLGKAKNVDRQNLWVKEASKSGRLVTKVGTGREHRRFNDESDAEIENRAAHEHHVLRVHENRERSVEVSISENMMVFADRRTCRWIQGGDWWPQRSSDELVGV